jgi:prephenate dehydrogenase
MIITVIGTGLIGGSMALSLKKMGYASTVIGVDTSEAHLQDALQLGIIDEIASLEVAVQQSNIIIIAVPVHIAPAILLQVLRVTTNQVIFDVGSTKAAICNAAQNYPNGAQFVATHPMWGTEFSGPQAATSNAFSGKAAVICASINTSATVLKKVEEIYTALGMHLVYMNAEEHDVHVAYISHISHITSFALANTVLEKEKEGDAIFELASAGFESTVRLAKSSASTWMPILRENKENVLDVLNEHISQLKKFKSCLEKENYTYLTELINNANTIKKVLDR